MWGTAAWAVVATRWVGGGVGGIWGGGGGGGVGTRWGRGKLE